MADQDQRLRIDELEQIGDMYREVFGHRDGDRAFVPATVVGEHWQGSEGTAGRLERRRSIDSTMHEHHQRAGYTWGRRVWPPD